MSSPEQRSQFIVRPSGIREIKPAVEHTSPVKFMVFIDAENLRKSVRELGDPERAFSYRMLFDLITTDGTDSMRVNFYTNNADLPERFLGFLIRNNIRIVSIPGKEIHGEIKEGPIDTVIAVDMMEQADLYEEAILISGDGDFGYPVEKLIRERGKKVTVISDWRSVGKELPASGAKVIFLDDLIPMLTYIKRLKPGQSAPRLKIVS